MLILLPPSEGKTPALRGKSLNADDLSFPTLAAARQESLGALISLCSGDPALAAKTLGLTPGQLDLIELNASLTDSATARADHVYSGVLYDALGLTTLDAAAKRRATSRVAITSSLFGLVRPGDRIPAYRLSGDASLPGLGSIAGHWRRHLPAALDESKGLIVDLRSSMYAAFWRPPASLANRVATVRVLHEHNGQRKVVSHFNKATKGRIVRALLEDGRDPKRPAALAGVLTELGWHVEVGEATPKGTQLDVIVTEI